MSAESPAAPLVRLEPWSQADVHLLHRLVGDPVMMAHLGGSETPEQVVARQQRYLELQTTTSGRSLRVVDLADDEAVGWVGYWPSAWQAKDVVEVGWSIVPERQGRGLARAAAALVVVLARETHPGMAVQAFPARANAASNAICRGVGFTLVGPCEVEYPPGSMLEANDWRIG